MVQLCEWNTLLFTDSLHVCVEIANITFHMLPFLSFFVSDCILHACVVLKHGEVDLVGLKPHP